ncbi:hypothetical protein EC968_009793 [Mortierella alpina]|nr:hypothetical protein EC968_009793 [Mortierella alpina]
MKILAITTIKCILPFFLLMSGVVACPPDEETTRALTAPVGKALESTCKIIKIVGTKEINWIKTNMLPFYLNKKFLTKDPPKGLTKELDKIQKKCHKDSYNYCNEADRDKAGECVKGFAGGLMLKYGAAAMAYCPILDKIVKDWPIEHQKRFQEFLTDLCKTKGLVC